VGTISSCSKASTTGWYSFSFGFKYLFFAFQNHGGPFVPHQHPGAPPHNKYGGNGRFQAYPQTAPTNFMPPNMIGRQPQPFMPPPLASAIPPPQVCTSKIFIDAFTL
jgi:hypothetical protein